MRKKNLQTLVLAAMLAALASTLKLLSIPLSVGTFIKDVNLSPSIIMYASISLGPVYGGLVGAIADVVGFIVRPMGAYNPLFTITNALVGIIPYFLIRKNKPLVFWRILFSVAITQTICSFFINTVVLIGAGMPAQLAWVRALSTFVFIPVHSLLIFALSKVPLPMRKINSMPIE